MLSKIRSLLKRQKHSVSSIATLKRHTVSVWEDTGEVFYLENTLKLTYQSNNGTVTMEKLPLESIGGVLRTIDNMPSGSPLGRLTVANQDSAYSLSLCAVTWQTNQNSVRVKAIADAAILRSSTACFSQSQAVFRHAFLLEHDDLLSVSLNSAKEGVFTYNRVSVEDFSAQITQANAKLSDRFRKAINVQKDNFDSAFTEHENTIIEGVLNNITSSKALKK